jgi:hypothetical protein
MLQVGAKEEGFRMIKLRRMKWEEHLVRTEDV